MIEMNFDVPLEEGIGHSWLKVKDRDPKSIKEIDLQYKYFYSHIKFAVNDLNLITGSGWVTLFDFASSVAYVVKRLADRQRGAIDFTEDDVRISFIPFGEMVEIVVSGGPEGRTSVPRLELIDHMKSFASRACDAIVDFCPALLENEFVMQLRQDT